MLHCNPVMSADPIRETGRAFLASLPMRPVQILLLSLLLLGLGAVGAVNAAGRLSAALACRADYRSLCAGVPMGGGRVAECLAAHLDKLSPGCLQAMAAGAPAAAATSGGAGSGRVLRDLAYDRDKADRLDVYIPAGARNAPILVMMHGGAWVIGSKNSRSVVEAKTAHWLPKGYIFVSVETRLLPAATPLQQAGDLASAIAYVQNHAAEWGGNAGSVVLMGHSAGAHLAALLAADPALSAKGMRPLKGTIALDSAAYDVETIMKGRHARLYDRAFGTDPAVWRANSPTLRVHGKPAPALLVCSSKRAESCDQANGFAAALKRAGGRATVLPEDLTHMDINDTLGRAGAYTAAVDGFLKSLGLP